MTTQEFSNEFDTLINSYSTTENFGSLDSPLNFDEYEKSVFLTNAQEEIVKELYSGKNTFRDSVEKTEEIRANLNPLIRNIVINGSSNNPSEIHIQDHTPLSGEVDNIWYILYEEAIICKIGDEGKSSKEYVALIVPTQIDDYYKTMNNPFKQPTKSRVLRIYKGGINEYSRSLHLILPEGYRVIKYACVYLAAPNPIILEQLPDGLKINNTSLRSECELSTALHRKILERAVQKALQSRFIGAKQQQ